MNHVISFFAILAFCLALNTASTAQVASSTDDIAYAAEMGESSLFIHFTSLEKADEIFPELYPIGYIVQEKDEQTNKINYLLGAFSNAEIKEVLAEVKSLGYAQSYVVERK